MLIETPMSPGVSQAVARTPHIIMNRKAARIEPAGKLLAWTSCLIGLNWYIGKTQGEKNIG